MLEAIGIGLLGCGTVGCGTLEILQKQRDLLAARAGRPLEVVHVAVRDVQKKRAVALDGVRLSDTPMAVVTDPQVAIVCELMGGMEPARTLITRALEAGKHVVTANKAVLSLHGAELMALAERQGVILAFEAAVAGGIPIVKALHEGLSANSVHTIVGIMNGTTNFVLSRMYHEQKGFYEALEEAQNLGYAEADPGSDIDGVDAAQKLSILAGIAFGASILPTDIYVEGIRTITLADTQYAKELGYRIKHLAIACRKNGKAELHVYPALIPRRSILSDVEGVKNAILLVGDSVGSTVYYGDGAGGLPTGSAVVADLVQIARLMSSAIAGSLGGAIHHSKAPLVIPMDELHLPYYLRIEVINRPGVLSGVTRILGEHEISIEAIVQKEKATTSTNNDTVPVVILTHAVHEQAMQAALRDLVGLESIVAPVTMIRVEHRLHTLT